MSTELHIHRHSDDTRQTRGIMAVMRGVLPVFACLSLELPWRNNERRVSCIPPHRYKAVKHTSPKFGECIHITNVPGRDGILIHPANRVDQLLGCVAPGLESADINGDGLPDITQSKLAMQMLLKALPNEFEVVYHDHIEP